MKVIYPEELNSAEKAAVTEISDKFRILPVTAEILYRRGINSVEKADRFFSAGKKWFLDPFDLTGMRDAVNRIYLARENEEKVLIFGDYDADGICATAVLSGSLKLFGIIPDAVIPERDDGYGLNVEKVLSQKNPPRLIITVDCGISDAEKIEILKRKGIDVIVTDHHEPPEVLPDCICINPKIKGQKYAFSGLCGCGVAYKLSRALIGDAADGFLDFVALATVADSMDLTDENRDLVVEGLKIFNEEPRPIFKNLLGDAGKDVTAQTLAFGIAPKVNAGGRMGDALCALKLFTAEKERDIFDLSAKLNGYNLLRQTDCEEVLECARRIVYDSGAYKDRIILVKGEAWKSGVIGIVAAKLAEVYDKPVIVFAKNDDIYKGSARSVDGINIFDAVNSAKDLLLTFGGHSQAVGVSVSEKNFEKFRKAVNLYAEENFPERAEKIIYADVKVDGVIPVRLAKELDLLEPYGVANRRPVFAEDVRELDVKPLKEGSPHYKFSTDGVEMLDFNGVKDAELLLSPVKKTLIFELNLSVFKQKESLKGFLKTIICGEDDIADAEGSIYYRELSTEGKTERIKAVETKINGGYGTAYIVSDVKTLEKLPRPLRLKVYPFDIPDESGENCIVVSPKNISDKYRTVIYLDKPFLFNDFNGRAFRIEDPLYDMASGIKTSRTAFADAFAFFSAKTGEQFKDVIGAAISSGENKRQYLFCLKVFTELGFFYVENGIMKRDITVKRPLKESLLYRTAESREC